MWLNVQLTSQARNRGSLELVSFQVLSIARGRHFRMQSAMKSYRLGEKLRSVWQVTFNNWNFWGMFGMLSQMTWSKPPWVRFEYWKRSVSHSKKIHGLVSELAKCTTFNNYCMDIFSQPMINGWEAAIFIGGLQPTTKTTQNGDRRRKNDSFAFG